MSFSISNDFRQAVLSSAILLYSTSEGNVSFATVHPVTTEEGQPPLIGAGEPLNEGALKRLASDLVATLRLASGVLPANVLSISGDHIAWWSPPSRKTYYFATEEGEGKVGERSGSAWTPGLIFVVQGSSMSLYAVKGNERPTADSPLFHAPLMNVYADGRLCTGTMPIPQTTLAESIVEWEKSFWGSRFSHPNHHHAVSYKGGLHALSIALLDGRFRKFPERLLRSRKQRLGELIGQLDANAQGRSE